MRRILLIICFFVVGAVALYGQELTVGQIPLKLGMTMQQVAAAVHDPIYLDDPQPVSSLVIQAIRQKQGDLYELIGTVSFVNGRVFSISRDLGSFRGSEAVNVGQTLFQAIQRLHTDEPSVPVFTKSSFISSVEGENKMIIIGTGVRRITLSLPDPSKNGTVLISEELTSAPPPK